MNIYKRLMVVLSIAFTCNAVAHDQSGLAQYAGISLGMSIEDRISNLGNQGFKCETRQSIPYSGYWECKRNTANIIFNEKEMLLNCAVLRQCNRTLEEVAISVVKDNSLQGMEPSTFYPPIGKLRWYCGKLAPQNVKLCVKQLVSIDQMMVEIERAKGNPEVVDFLLAKQRPHLHILQY